jgi:hypothetical protein
VFTERLRTDLQAEAWKYRYLTEYHREVLAAAVQAADALDGTVPLDDEALLVSAYRASQYLGVPARRATYDELISTGTIGLIRDPALRSTAVGAFTTTTFDTLRDDGMTSPYRVAFRMLLPHRVQDALAQQCGDQAVDVGDYAGVRGSLDYSCETGLDADELASAAQSLRNDPRLVPLLYLRIADLETRLADLTQMFNHGTLTGLRELSMERTP